MTDRPHDLEMSLEEARQLLESGEVVEITQGPGVLSLLDDDTSSGGTTGITIRDHGTVADIEDIEASDPFEAKLPA